MRTTLSAISPGRALTALLVIGAVLATLGLPLVAQGQGLLPGAFFLLTLLALGTLQLARWVTVAVGILFGLAQAGAVPSLTNGATFGPQFLWPAFAFFTVVGCLAEIAGRAGIRIERSLALGGAEQSQVERRRTAPVEAMTPVGSSLDHELARARRYHFNLAFALLEIEAWQTMVAEKGRAVMAEQLSQATKHIRGRIRPSDELSYLGAGRYALVLPHTDLAGAHVVLERVQELLRADAGLKTRIGVAEFPDDSETSEGLMSEAEAALEATSLAAAPSAATHS